MALDSQSILVWLVVGLIAGWLAGLVMKGGGFGIVGDIVIGIIGAFIGSLLLPKLGLGIPAGFLGSIVVAFVGAVILLVIVRLVSGGSSRRTV